jgi:hypothetical protein
LLEAWSPVLAGGHHGGRNSQQLIDPANLLPERGVLSLQDKETLLRLLIGEYGSWADLVKPIIGSSLSVYTGA